MRLVSIPLMKLLMLSPHKPRYNPYYTPYGITCYYNVSYHIIFFFQILYYIILYIPTVSDSTCQAASDSAMTMPGDAATPDLQLVPLLSASWKIPPSIHKNMVFDHVLPHHWLAHRGPK
jgi:steroid 5-alpha reductase family enzyme